MACGKGSFGVAHGPLAPVSRCVVVARVRQACTRIGMRALAPGFGGTAARTGRASVILAAGERPSALPYASVRGAGVLSVTRAAVRGATDPARFERGQDYVDRVRSLRFAGSPLPCRVKGREPVVGKGRVLGTRLRR